MEKYCVTEKLKNIGFTHFQVLCENELPLDTTSDFRYWIDILPFRLKIENEKYYKCTIDDEIPRTSLNDLEDFYYSKDEMANLNQKKIRLIYKMAYYYELREIILYISLKDMYLTKDFSAENSQDFYMSVEPMYVMKNLKKFLSLVEKTMHTPPIYFCFTNGVTLNLDLEEIYSGIFWNENIDDKIIQNISTLSNSEGLFFYNNY